MCGTDAEQAYSKDAKLVVHGRNETSNGQFAKGIPRADLSFQNFHQSNHICVCCY